MKRFVKKRAARPDRDMSSRESFFSAWPSGRAGRSKPHLRREDLPDKVDPTQLHRAVVMGLTAMATLAHADSGQARDIAGLSLAYGRKRIARRGEAWVGTSQSTYAAGAYFPLRISLISARSFLMSQ
jgi:hypothetical protein